jgi:glycosyl transferase, family 25
MALQAGDQLRVFLINLDRSPDRLAIMRDRAAAIGLAFERLSAINGAALPDWLKPQFFDDAGTPFAPLSAGETGAYASHLMAHKRIIDDGLPHALILEDDVRLAPDVMRAASDAIAVAPTDWDYIHLSPVIKRPVYSVAQLTNGRHLVRFLRIPLGATGYLISRRGAAKMLAPVRRTRPIDTDIRWFRELNVLGVYPPAIVFDKDVPSTIGNESTRCNLRPSLFAKLKGHILPIRQMGIGGYLICHWSGPGVCTARGRATPTAVPPAPIS